MRPSASIFDTRLHPRIARGVCLLAVLVAAARTAAAEDLAERSLEQLLATPVTGAAKRAQKPIIVQDGRQWQARLLWRL